MFDDAWFWIFVSIMLFWGVGAYRRLVGLRTAVNKQFAVLEELMLRYQGLVQEATTAAVTATTGWQAAVSPELGASHWTRLQVAANLSAMALARMNVHQGSSRLVATMLGN